MKLRPSSLSACGSIRLKKHNYYCGYVLTCNSLIEDNAFNRSESLAPVSKQGVWLRLKIGSPYSK